MVSVTPSGRARGARPIREAFEGVLEKGAREDGTGRAREKDGRRNSGMADENLEVCERVAAALMAPPRLEGSMSAECCGVSGGNKAFGVVI